MRDKKVINLIEPLIFFAFVPDAAHFEAKLANVERESGGMSSGVFARRGNYDIIITIQRFDALGKLQHPSATTRRLISEIMTENA